MGRRRDEVREVPAAFAVPTDAERAATTRPGPRLLRGYRDRAMVGITGGCCQLVLDGAV